MKKNRNKVEVVIGCEGCQTTTVFGGFATSQEDALLKAEKRHSENNLYCDETLSSGGLFPIRISGDTSSLPRAGKVEKKQTKTEKLLGEIFKEIRK